MLRRPLNAWPVAAFATGLCLTISPALAEPTPKDVLTTYVDMAEAGYTDSLDTARTLKLAVDALLAKATEDNLRSAPPGSPPASPTCRPRPSASATPSSTIGKAG
jgi:putative iron-regulated protein